MTMMIYYRVDAQQRLAEHWQTTLAFEKKLQSAIADLRLPPRQLEVFAAVADARAEFRALIRAIKDDIRNHFDKGAVIESRVSPPPPREVPWFIAEEWRITTWDPRIGNLEKDLAIWEAEALPVYDDYVQRRAALAEAWTQWCVPTMDTIQSYRTLAETITANAEKGLTIDQRANSEGFMSGLAGSIEANMNSARPVLTAAIATPDTEGAFWRAAAVTRKEVVDFLRLFQDWADTAPDVLLLLDRMPQPGEFDATKHELEEALARGSTERARDLLRHLKRMAVSPAQRALVNELQARRKVMVAGQQRAAIPRAHERREDAIIERLLAVSRGELPPDVIQRDVEESEVIAEALRDTGAPDAGNAILATTAAVREQQHMPPPSADALPDLARVMRLYEDELATMERSDVPLCAADQRALAAMAFTLAAGSDMAERVQLLQARHDIALAELRQQFHVVPSIEPNPAVALRAAQALVTRIRAKAAYFGRDDEWDRLAAAAAAALAQREQELAEALEAQTRLLRDLDEDALSQVTSLEAWLVAVDDARDLLRHLPPEIRASLAGRALELETSKNHLGAEFRALSDLQARIDASGSAGATGALELELDMLRARPPAAHVRAYARFCDALAAQLRQRYVAPLRAPGSPAAQLLVLHDRLAVAHDESEWRAIEQALLAVQPQLTDLADETEWQSLLARVTRLLAPSSRAAAPSSHAAAPSSRAAAPAYDPASRDPGSMARTLPPRWTRRDWSHVRMMVPKSKPWEVAQ
jgi:hypothetical protein